MKCEKCNKKEACYHSTLIVNGNSKSVHLCEDCARKEGFLSDNRNDIFDVFFDNFTKPFDDMFNFDSIDKFICSSCGTNFDEFRKNHYLGCNNCFDNFYNKIDNFFKSADIESDDKIEFRTPKKTKLDEQIDEMQEKLNLAVKEERYEDAAKINKDLKALKQQRDENNKQ